MKRRKFRKRVYSDQGLLEPINFDGFDEFEREFRRAINSDFWANSQDAVRNVRKIILDDDELFKMESDRISILASTKRGGEGAQERKDNADTPPKKVMFESQADSSSGDYEGGESNTSQESESSEDVLERGNMSLDEGESSDEPESEEGPESDDEDDKEESEDDKEESKDNKEESKGSGRHSNISDKKDQEEDDESRNEASSKSGGTELEKQKTIKVNQNSNLNKGKVDHEGMF